MTILTRSLAAAFGGLDGKKLVFRGPPGGGGGGGPPDPGIGGGGGGGGGGPGILVRMIFEGDSLLMGLSFL